MARWRLSREQEIGFSEADMILLRHVGKTIKQHRLTANINIAELAVMSGISSDIIFGVESGSKDISLNDLLSIANALGVTALDLVEMS